MDIDDKIRRGIKIAGWSLLAIALSPFIVMVAVRNLPPNAERQAALDLLHRPMPPVRGRDGSDALWTLYYDVPVEKQAEAAAETRKYLTEYDRLDILERDEEARALPDPRQKYVQFAKVEGEPEWLCAERGLDCLATVRKDTPAAEQAVSEHAAALGAVDRLTTFDGVRWGLPPSLSQQVPMWGSQRRLVRTRHALDFVQGRQVDAMSGVCRELAGYRRLGADTDLFIGNMVAAAYIAQDLQLLSEMLAELPGATGLPADCTQALAPTRPEELDLCPVMSREFLSVEALYTKDTEAGLKSDAKPFWRAMVDSDHAVAIIAPVYATYCGPAMHAAAAADRPAASAHPVHADCGVFEKIGDPITCWMVGVGRSDYGHYQDARTDLAAKLALMRVIAWARARGQGDLADFKGVPVAALGLRRSFIVSADGRTASIPLYDKRKSDRFELQLKPPQRG